MRWAVQVQSSGPEKRLLVMRLLVQVLSTINNWLEYSAAEGYGYKGSGTIVLDTEVISRLSLSLEAFCRENRQCH